MNEVEKAWVVEFANPLIEKRRKVDAGDSTASELQIAYLQAEPGNWQIKQTAPLEKLNGVINAVMDKSKASDKTASFVTMAVTLGGFFLVIALGATIALRVAQSITSPLEQLTAVSSQIARSGDLDQKVEISSSDEVGELARTFNDLAATSEAIAGGDLSAEINPRGPRDTLGNAFREMTLGLRNLVKNVRDSAAQVASGSNQVASASDDSAKISVQAASAIDEVTSTMHEMSINVQNMVKNTQTQASSVSETSASIDQMVASIQRVADTAKVLLDISQLRQPELKTRNSACFSCCPRFGAPEDRIQSRPWSGRLDPLPSSTSHQDSVEDRKSAAPQQFRFRNQPACASRSAGGRSAQPSRVLRRSTSRAESALRQWLSLRCGEWLRPVA